MSEIVARARSIYERYWRRNIWAQSLVGFLAGTALLVRAADVFGFQEHLLHIIGAGFFITAFVVTRVSSTRAFRAERSWHHRTGVLYHGEEPNISFRVLTFRGILESLGNSMGDGKLGASLLSAGRVASEDFAEKLGNIYDADVRPIERGPRWSKLTLGEKLDEWAEYDTKTGWGYFRVKPENGLVKVTISHGEGLFEGQAGSAFTQFLAGYCETILTKVVESHKDGRHREYSRAELTNIEARDNAIQLLFSWK